MLSRIARGECLLRLIISNASRDHQVSQHYIIVQVTSDVFIRITWVELDSNPHQYGNRKKHAALRPLHQQGTGILLVCFRAIAIQ